MEQYKMFRCLTCDSIFSGGERVNNPYHGWKLDGTLTNVDNYCCPSCGSNNIVPITDNVPILRQIRAKFQAIAAQEGRERAIKDCAKHAGISIKTMRDISSNW